MSGDGPLSIDVDGLMTLRGKGWAFVSKAADAIAVASQLDRARRCAEAETNLLLCSLALSSMEDERDDARAERDAALADRDNWKDLYLTAIECGNEITEERNSLRAELAARPDLSGHKCQPSTPPRGLTEWCRLAERYGEAGLGNDMTDQTRTALANMTTFLTQPAECYCPCRVSRPDPAPDTVTITGYVHDAGGGHIDVLVDRDTLNYPWIGARCTLIVEKKP